MATKKPRPKRIALTVPADIDAKLKRLSDITGQPKTAIIMDFLADLVPSIDRVIEALYQVKQGQREVAIQTMAEFINKASVDLNQAQLALDDMKGAENDR